MRQSTVLLSVGLSALAAALVGCRSDPMPIPSASASASAPRPETWSDRAALIWGGGDEPVEANLTAIDEGRDAGKPGDKVMRSAVLTGRFNEQGDALPPAIADRIIKTMRIPGGPPAVFFRLFRNDITPDAALGTVAIVNDPAAPIDWSKVQPRELGKLLPEPTRPTRQRTSISLTRQFARAWRVWATSYDERWDGKTIEPGAAITLCEHAAALELAPGSVIPTADQRGKDCPAPKLAATKITFSCFAQWEDKRQKYDCSVEPGAHPVIAIK